MINYRKVIGDFQTGKNNDYIKICSKNENYYLKKSFLFFF